MILGSSVANSFRIGNQMQQ